MATFYGSDTACLTDLPLISTSVSDPVQLIGQRLARRLQTPPGALRFINGNPDGGFDVRQFINGKLSPSERAAAQATIAAECQKDEEVQSASCVISQADDVLTITVKALSAFGPFTLVLTVDELTASALVFNG